ncbi:MAG: flagellin [Oceanospirillaceae bacterium]|nr:flagellin [Oceanospirillaceae bacterium]
MPMVINSNIASLNAQRNLMASSNDMSTAMERLSSGKRINTAADDAAGLAIANRFTSQIRGLDQAQRNANDGISLIQTAEGGLQEATNILQRMRELAIQSANGTYDSGNRQTLNAEVQQLKAELDRISSSTSFNGQFVLNGSLEELELQVGDQANQTVTVGLAEISNEALGVAADAGVSSITETSVSTAVTTAANALNSLGSGDLIINGISIDAATSEADTASRYGKTASAISTAAAINEFTAETGVTAIVNETVLGGSVMTAGDATGTVTINGTAISIQTTADAASTRAAVVEAINAKAELTGVVAVDTGSKDEGVRLVAADGRNISVEFATVTGTNTGIGLATAAGSSIVATGTVTLVSDSEIEISSNATGDATDAGFKEGVYSNSYSQITSELSSNTSTTALATGDLVINGVAIRGTVTTDDTASSSNSDASAIAIATVINEVSSQTGVTAEPAENLLRNGGAQLTTALAVSMTLNGVAITGFTTVANDTSGNRQSLVSAINAISDQTGVVAIDTGVDGTSAGGGVELIAVDGRNIVIDATNIANGGLAVADGTYRGEVTLQSDGAINIGSLTANLAANAGFSVGTFGGGASGQSIANIDISTVKGAQNAISGIDNALDTINSLRGDLGAASNRLQFTINNLSNVSENLSAARSRVEDADFAKESAALSRAQVLQQAGTAILAQANALPQQVLSLLQ